MILKFLFFSQGIKTDYGNNNSSTVTQDIRKSEKRSFGSLPSPRSEGDILSSPNLKAFSFNELKSATRNFRPDSLIGEGGFGYVYKGWLDEQSLEATRPGYGLVVAVKKLKSQGFQGHKEWLVSCFSFQCLQHQFLPSLIIYLA